MSTISESPLAVQLLEAAADVNGSRPLAVSYRKWINAITTADVIQHQLEFTQALIRIMWINRDHSWALKPHLWLFSRLSHELAFVELKTFARPSPALRAESSSRGEPVDDLVTMGALVTVNIESSLNLAGHRALVLKSNGSVMRERSKQCALSTLASLATAAGFIVDRQVDDSLAQSAILRNKVVISEFDGTGLFDNPQALNGPLSQRFQKALSKVIQSFDSIL